jgi:hypothetical protein
MTSTRLLVDVFLRKAQWVTDDGEFACPQEFLRVLIEGKYEELVKGRQIQAVSGNGRSTTFSLPVEMSPTEILQIAELAYQMLDNNGLGTMTHADFSGLRR